MENAPDSPHERLAWAREKAGFADKAAFAKVVDVNPTTYRAYENGQNGFSKLAPRFAKALGVTAEWLLDGGDTPKVVVSTASAPSRVSLDQPSIKTADGGETAPVVRLDLSYSMGPGTDLDDSYVEGEAFQFDIGFLRGLTITPPDRLRIVDGIGTSMEPTLHDRDLLLVDINQRDLNAQDRVWACWIFGLGAVKRLRAIGTNTVLVMSDNPDVPDQEVSRKDILIHGRVVGSIKRH
ncbi:XRE family transcriptional regulator [Sphingomonas sp.]|uniref:XRE family transcriptional regulator n=1 Tax=Sphingomonas sp. TaxID=28214 RepID=UPI0035C7A4BB